MKWKYTGSRRPDFAIEPAAGQESVWDYPRPPVIREEPRRIVVVFNGYTIADTKKSFRVLETASPPGFYIPSGDINQEFLISGTSSSICEWKGRAIYWTVKCGGAWARNAAWSYPYPAAGYISISNYISFYPAMLECRVDNERVRPQPGYFYGGWITSEIIGPFKGSPGTEDW